MRSAEPATPELSDHQLLGLSVLAAIVLTLAEYLFIPLRFPGLFPRLVEELLPGLWHGSLERAIAAGATGPWWGPLLPFLWWSGGLALVWIALPALAAQRCGLAPRDLGWGLADLRAKLPIYALLFVAAVPALLWASRKEGFLATYPMLRPDQVLDWSWRVVVIYWLLYGFQFLAVEFFFRGFLLFCYAGRLGRAAIGVMVIPYCMIHYHKPLPEVFGAVIAGLVLGWLALETRSIWGGVLLHVAVALSMDLLALGRGPWGLPSAW